MSVLRDTADTLDSLQAQAAKNQVYSPWAVVWRTLASDSSTPCIQYTGQQAVLFSDAVKPTTPPLPTHCYTPLLYQWSYFMLYTLYCVNSLLPPEQASLFLTSIHLGGLLIVPGNKPSHHHQHSIEVLGYIASS